MGRFRISGDLSAHDRTVEIEAATLDDLFETAACALCELLADPDSVTESVERTITLAAQDPEALFHHWLCELVYLKDRYREAYKTAKTRVTGSGPCCLVARLRGDALGSPRLAPWPDVRAACPHGLRLESMEDGEFRARFVVETRAAAPAG